jgi:FAD/FMN-containing dehydrogenase
MSRLRRITTALVRTAFTVAGLSTLGGLALVGWLETGANPLPDQHVQDVTELIDLDVERIATPRSIEEVRRVVGTYDGPISIGGGRFSMGGQIGTDDTLFLDLRELDDVLELDPAAKTVRVEAGITWRKLIEALDPHDLSVQIMQSYANFTVGGTLSVNAHGRYMGLGPVVHSVRSLDLVLADGSLVHASRDENADLFHSAIGGYGGLGVIVAVELSLADNVKLKRTVKRMPFADFEAYFQQEVLTDPDVVMFNADLYPPAYDDLVAILFSETDDPVTVPDRLQQGGGSTATDRLMYWWVSEGPLGKQARSEVIDRMRLASEPVVFRNHEASYDVAGLDPGSRASSTYVLQEYFIPLRNLSTFTPKMAKIFTDHEVNVVNVSIRHATADPDTLLTWAPEECFAFVIYYKMGTSPDAWAATETWTRAMADAILEEEGTWYLPYQIHATPEQFRRGYPRHAEFAALKERVDPDHTFRNRLWDRYLPPATRDETAIRERLAARSTWHRPPDQTFLTLPEWMVVYSADEAGAFLRENPPSAFPWFDAVAQFWRNYRAVWAVTRDRYAFNTGYHVMIGVVGASYTVEMVGKGIYENTVGKLFEGGSRVAAEDHYAQVTSDYGAFTHHTPWYAFPFAERRAELADLPSDGTWRATERHVASWVELTAKSWWAGAIASATGTAYAPEAETVEAWVRGDRAQLAGIDGLEVVESLGGDDLLVRLPRYEPFTAAAIALAERGVEIVEVAGGASIVVQVVVPTATELDLWGDTLVRWDILTVPGRERVALEVPIRRLDEVLPALRDAGATIEHLYDF